ncbi:MAG: ABC transporter permease, partial [Anaerolineaceae bacterium]|nr:ABC transporter permease [Anaerolineaceae bacterium]
YTQLVFIPAQKWGNEQHVREVAAAAAEKLRKNSTRVFSTSISHAGQHPSQQVLNALLALMGGLGILAVFLSAFLVINTISALMSQQIRQIGVMKALGATFAQVAGLYLVLVLAFGVAALIIAIPAAAAAAYAMCILLTRAMNITLAPFRIPAASILLQVMVGLGVPALSALAPVIGGARLTVRDAISSYGMSLGGKRSGFDLLLETVRGLPRPLLLSIRNTFRRKGRLFLTLSTLTLGGAIFISVFSVRDSINAALEKTFGYTLADVNASFSRSYRIDRMQEVANEIPGVVSVECWIFESAQIMRLDGESGDDVQIIAPPSGSRLIQPVMTSGRWLVKEDENAIVVGNHYMKVRPETKLGDVIQVRIGEKEFAYMVIGIYEMAGNPATPMVYTNYESLAANTGKLGLASSLRIVTDRSDPVRQTEVQKGLENRFRELGMQVAMQTGSETIAQQTFPVKILITLLLTMAVLIALVGGLGLMGTMSMNVMERTREIGVMRSIGAVNLAIFQLVISEGMLIGLISWGIGALLSVPFARFLNQAVGLALFNVPLRFIFSVEGLVIWLGVVLILSALASLIPARNAVRLTVRDILAYE